MKIYDLSQKGKACFFTVIWKVGHSRAVDQRDVDDTSPLPEVSRRAEGPGGGQTFSPQ